MRILAIFRAVIQTALQHRIGWWGSLALAYIFQWGAYQDYCQVRRAVSGIIDLPQQPTWWLWAIPFLVWITASLFWQELRSRLTEPAMVILPQQNAVVLDGGGYRGRRFWRFALSNAPIWRTQDGVASNCHVVASFYQMRTHQIGHLQQVAHLFPDESCPWRENVETGHSDKYTLDVPANNMPRDFLALVSGDIGTVWQALRNNDVEFHKELDGRRALPAGHCLIRFLVEGETINQRIVGWFFMRSSLTPGESAIVYVPLDLDDDFDRLVWDNMDKSEWHAANTSP